ncbi:MAG: TraR/DksA C4-type zinc finger protein [Ferruginibacter sp.]
MATKKQFPAKTVKAASKPVAKKVVKVVKPTPKKALPAVKTAPAKPLPKTTVAKTVGNKTNPAPKKTIAKTLPSKLPVKIAPVKNVSKPAPQKIISKTSGLPVKPMVNTTPKKVSPINQTAPPVTKQLTKKAVVVKHTPIKAANPAPNIMAKKEEIKNPVVKSATEKAVPAKPAAEVKAKDIKVPTPKAVVIPKISQTVRKYQPEFTKSVLDKAQRDPGAPSQRYSDSELLEFRELIQRKLEAAKKELSYLHGLITRKDEMGGDEGDNRYMTMEDGSLSMEREQLSQMASRQITFIDHLEKAVMRIENKTYGICRVTGKLIDKARLRAVPHATLSIEAKMSGK